MRTILGITLGFFLIGFATPSPAQGPAHFWSKRFGSTGSDRSHAVAVDGSGNVVVTGEFAGSVSFGGTTLVSAGGADIFVAKYNASGAYQWSQSFGSAGTDVSNSVAVDGSGNVVITGAFTNTVNFGGVPLVSAGSQDIFLAKFDPNGVHQWSQSFGSTGGDAGNSVVVDGLGGVVMTGGFVGTVNFGGVNLMSVGGQDVYVAKYTSGGTHQWSQRYGSTSPDVGNAVAVDASRNVIVTGQFNLAVSFGGGTLSSAGGYDIFLAKYNSSGVHQWSKRFGGGTYDAGEAVAADASGNVVATGSFEGTANFGGGNVVAAGGGDVFLAKYDAGGVHQWSQRFGGASGEVGNGVTVDASGNVVMTGFFFGLADFGGGNLTSAGNADIFAARYGPSGKHVWSERYGSTANEIGNGVAVDASENVVVTGYFNGTVTFGGANLTSAGGDEVFVAKYGSFAAEPLITSVVDVGNDQGGKVRIQFSRSGYDAVEPASPTQRYEAYRRNDALPSAMTASPAGPLSRQQLLDLGWVDAGSTQAHAAAGYVMDAPTDADSTSALGQHYSVFFIRAAMTTPSVFYDSAADSGYSIDNLAPGVPASFAYTTGVLSWDESSAADFDYFSIYGGSTNAFGSATLVDYTTATDLDVNASPYVFYFVTATDFSGNEGKPAVINTLSGTGETPTQYVLSISSYPNPFNPETTVRYTVPAKGRVTIEVFDARGGHVATLVNQETEAGAFTVTWNGQDGRGNAAGSGVYFARLTSPAGHRSYKMTLLK